MGAAAAAADVFPHTTDCVCQSAAALRSFLGFDVCEDPVIPFRSVIQNPLCFKLRAWPARSNLKPMLCPAVERSLKNRLTNTGGGVHIAATNCIMKNASSAARAAITS